MTVFGGAGECQGTVSWFSAWLRQGPSPPRLEHRKAGSPLHGPGLLPQQAAPEPHSVAPTVQLWSCKLSRVAAGCQDGSAGRPDSEAVRFSLPYHGARPPHLSCHLPAPLGSSPGVAGGLGTTPRTFHLCLSPPHTHPSSPHNTFVSLRLHWPRGQPRFPPGTAGGGRRTLWGSSFCRRLALQAGIPQMVGVGVGARSGAGALGHHGLGSATAHGQTSSANAKGLLSAVTHVNQAQRSTTITAAPPGARSLGAVRRSG